MWGIVQHVLVFRICYIFAKHILVTAKAEEAADAMSSVTLLGPEGGGGVGGGD